MNMKFKIDLEFGGVMAVIKINYTAQPALCWLEGDDVLVVLLFFWSKDQCAGSSVSWITQEEHNPSIATGGRWAVLQANTPYQSTTVNNSLFREINPNVPSHLINLKLHLWVNIQRHVSPLVQRVGWVGNMAFKHRRLIPKAE